MGFVEMRIVDSRNPEPLPTALQTGRLVDQDREAVLLKIGNHFDEIVVSENSEAPRRECGANSLQLPKARTVVSVDAVSEIPGHHRHIMGSGPDELFDHGSQGGVEIGMEVAELEEAKPLEGGWKRGKPPFLTDELDIQKPPPQNRAEPKDSQSTIKHGIEREETLQTENALALMEEMRALVGLPLQSLFEENRPEPPTKVASHFGIHGSPACEPDQRITRPSWPRFSPGFGTS
jgi:hypothetical protein